MKKIVLVCIVLLALVHIECQAVPAYGFRVQFKDKNGTLSFADSLQFLSSKALSRRAFQGITLDSSDLPVVKQYIDTVMLTANAIKLHNVSKWFNQCVVITNDSSKAVDLLALPMVQSVKCVAVYANGFSSFMSNTKFEDKFATQEAQKKTRGASSYYSLSFQQIDLIQADCLHDLGYMGQGMDIGVFDVNFRFTNTCFYFDSLMSQNRVKDQYSFVKDTPFVFLNSVNTAHGKDALGCMAAFIPGTYVGSAPKANYFLYNTEDIVGERPIEEDNWLSAAERADSIGLYIVNSSLGYNKYDAPLQNSSYTYSTHLDGKTTLIAQAANKLTSKGIIVVQAMGNEGCQTWHWLLTPADADSVISVGSVDGSGIWACSGYGPNSAGVTKPDVACVGKSVMLIPDNCTTPDQSNGSSFASPTMCGAIACLWQAFPNKTAYQIKQIVKMSSSKYSSPDNTIGYGIPDFCKAYSIATNVEDIKHVDHTYLLYPNPTENGAFTIKSFSTSANNFTFALYDLTGKCVYRDQKINRGDVYTKALQHAANGEYVLVISTLNQLYSTKIIKQ